MCSPYVLPQMRRIASSRQDDVNSGLVPAITVGEFVQRYSRILGHAVQIICTRGGDKLPQCEHSEDAYTGFLGGWEHELGCAGIADVEAHHDNVEVRVGGSSPQHFVIGIGQECLRDSDCADRIGDALPLRFQHVHLA